MFRQFDQSIARFVFFKHIAKPPRLADAPWVGVPVVHKVEDIQFAGTESGQAVRKFFKQRNERRSKSRQDHQIRHQQIETRFWRCGPIGSPSAACGHQMVVGHLGGRQLPFCDRLWSVVRNNVIRMHQAQLRRDLLVGAKQVEQPDEHELIVGLRIDPHFDRIELRT